jgi:hypothetical protein
MKYMLLIYGPEQAWTDEERAACMSDAVQLCHRLDAKGQYIAASPLHSVTTATSLRLREGKRLVTDGPFAETAEQLGGFLIIDVPNLDDALDVAAEFPSAGRATIEVRPLFDLPGLPGS